MAVRTERFLIACVDSYTTTFSSSEVWVAGELRPLEGKWGHVACGRSRSVSGFLKNIYFNLYIFNWSMGFTGGSNGKESACSSGDLGSVRGSGRSPGEGNGNPLRYSCLENSRDRGAWRAIVHGSQRVGHDWVTFPFTFALQYCVGFCHISTRISYRSMYVPPLPTSTLSYPSLLSEITGFELPAPYRKLSLAI